MTARVPLKTIRFSRNELSQFEDNATEDIAIGMLVEQTSDGYAPHSTDGGVPTRKLIATEGGTTRPLQLSPDGMDDEHGYYASGENVEAHQPSGGAGFTMWLAGGNTVSHGDALVSNGDGRLRPAAGDGSDDGNELFEADFKNDYYDSLDVTTDAGEPQLVDVINVD